ncbi:hypothetical protein CLV88_102227 [Shimia abyssi]|uniref:Uncharacterized protein n=1 Tax=Shimia abyssi TaxID=1662395 RepID=A0A2P8FHB1_9RHOB|nr:hypothetical protein CLV88_102227 [Shimia abyssi]
MQYERFQNTNTPSFGPEIEAEAKVEEGERLVHLSF